MSWTAACAARPNARPSLNFRREDVKLQPIGVDVIGGFVFVNLDPRATPLKPVAIRILARSCSPCARRRRSSVIVKRQDFAIKANWKVVVENFLENYHSFYSGPAHKQLSDVIDQDSYRWTIEGKVIEFLGKGGTCGAVALCDAGRAALHRPQ